MGDGKFRETKITGRTLFEGRVLTLEVDQVRLPGGDDSEREVVRHRGAAVMVPVTDDGRVIFVRQYRYPTSEVLLELPAGKLEKNEDPAVCAVRETAEETGFRPRSIERLGEFYTAPGYTDELIWAFLVEGLESDGEACMDADEIVEPVTLSIEEYRKMALRGEIRDAKTISAMALYLMRRQ